MNLCLINSIVKKHGYKVLGQIGEGGSAKCFKVFSEKYHRTFVLKVSQHKKSYTEECLAYHSLFHQNIALCFDAFVDQSLFFLILEDCTEEGNLETKIKKNLHISKEDIFQYATQIASGISFLHKNEIAHLDIKPQNILIDSYNRCKICDFGIAYNCEHNPICNKFSGTRIFMAPEMILKKPFDAKKADVWAFGVTLYYISCRFYPWKSLKDQETCISLGKYIRPYIADKEIQEIISFCLNFDPASRPTIDEVLEKLEQKCRTFSNTSKLPNLHVNKISVPRQPFSFMSGRIENRLTGRNSVNNAITSRRICKAKSTKYTPIVTNNL